MGTSQTLPRSFTILALAAVLTVGLMTLLPTEAYGASCFMTFNRNIVGTSSVDRPWAIMSFHNKANQEADDTCNSLGQSVCFYQETVPAHCDQPNAPFTATGSVTFKCSGIPQRF